MQHNDPLTVIRQYFVESGAAQASPGTKAVEVERALERAGLAVVSADVMAAFAVVVTNMGCTAFQFAALMQQLGLAKIVPFDPARHDACGEEIMVGDDFLEYSPALKAVLMHARPHLAGVRH
ncbi:MAG: hypothetical protein QHD01_05925 [Bradyrhizobium sp.]|uniref:hypothetical protein n=1 Tax=Bradyrhizobium sp. TaxID=376 RepID=UPI0029AD4FEF|nr:hypothetical protein [Bradyrhizobium sp.]MDX3966123.1 hypothetical protein [Bradyrhizobium sp.]